MSDYNTFPSAEQTKKTYEEYLQKSNSCDSEFIRGEMSNHLNNIKKFGNSSLDYSICRGTNCDLLVKCFRDKGYDASSNYDSRYYVHTVKVSLPK